MNDFIGRNRKSKKKKNQKGTQSDGLESAKMSGRRFLLRNQRQDQVISKHSHRAKA